MGLLWSGFVRASICCVRVMFGTCFVRVRVRAAKCMLVVFVSVFGFCVLFVLVFGKSCVCAWVIGNALVLVPACIALKHLRGSKLGDRLTYQILGDLT